MAHLFSLEDIVAGYQDINRQLTWSSAAFYLLLFLITWLVYAFGIKPFLSPLRKLPGPGYNPFFGNVREAMVGESMESSTRWVKKYGGVLRFYHLLGRERVLVADPLALKRIFTDNVNNYSRIPAGQSGFFTKGIFFAIGDEHKKDRRLMNPFFNHEYINDYLSIFQEFGSKLVDNWSSKLKPGSTTNIEVQNDLKRLALDIICQSVFGYEVGSLENPNSDFLKAFSVITSVRPISFRPLIPFASYFPSKREKEVTRCQDYITKVVLQLIAEKRQQVENNEPVIDLLSRLIRAQDEETGRALNDDELRNQIISLLIAGHETTSVTMAWLLLILAQKPEIQEKVRDEVTSLLPDSGPITWDDLDKLHYTTAVIKETQRLYPAAPTFTRRAINDDVLNGHFIPAGTTVIYHVGAMMRNPAIWPDPEKFDPTRFLSEENHTPGDFPALYTHLPFVTGPHKCLGHQFAKMQMKMVISLVLSKFKFALVDGRKYIRKLKITLNPEPPVVLAVSRV